MKKILALVFLLNLNIFALTAGVDYQVLPQAVATQSNDKVEVRELFWYYCPHCYRLEPSLQHWLKSVDYDVVDFVSQPAVFSQRWEQGAMFYYVLEKLDLFEQLHLPLFDAIHLHKIRLNTDERFAQWVSVSAQNPDITSELVLKAIQSFSVNSKVKRAKQQTDLYAKNGVNGVPTFIVNGKYSVSLSQAQSEQNLFATIDALVDQEKALR